ncbi:replication factor-A C terminal domain-containing protein [Mycena vitilis]|nr:replication factor-A C terminal domain-containing protein [Mycena vitilis]
MVVQLTAGSCIGLQNAAPGDASLFDATHTLQLLSVRLVGSNTTSTVDRYRIIVSDGEHFIQAMLATQLNHLVKDDQIKKNTIVNVTKMTCNFVQDKRLLIILSLDVVEHASEKIGAPATLGPEPGQAATTPTASSSTHQTPAPPAPPPVQRQAAAPAAATNRPIYPIEGLSPYQNNWTIKARVIQKGEMKTFSNQKGEGQLFNVTLMDETGEIRATAFNAVAIALYDKLQEGKVYYVSRARVNIAKKQFSHLSNEYELGFEKNTDIEECLDSNVPDIKYDFVPLGDLEKIAKDSTCDVIGIVKEVADTSEITSKATNRQIVKRELTLVDTSGFSVRMTLWGKQAEQFNSPEAVIAFKSVKVGDYGGRSLSFFSSSTMALNPDIPAAHKLRGWYDESGKNASYQAHQSTGGGGASGGTGFQRNEMRNILDVKTKMVGEASSQESEYFSLRATIVFMKPDSMWYAACQTCNKKVTEDTDGTWRCEKCNQSWPQPKYRYIMAMACSDWSDQAWLQGFNEVGELVFGKTADELEALKRADEAAFASTVQEATCETYNFLCRARSDDYNGQSRVRYGISRIQPLNYKEEGMALRDLLHSPWGQTAI